MHKRHLTLSLAAAALLAGAGCGQQDAQSRAGASAPPSARAAPSASAGVGETSGGSAQPDALMGCERYADADELAAIRGTPVLDVVAEDPALSWFSAALTGEQSMQVDYRDVLVGGQFTVFAPLDDAVDGQLRQGLADDPAALRFFLDYHIIPGQALSPQGLLDTAARTSGGAVPTLQGWELAAFTPVDGAAELALSEDTVVPQCGDIHTADARLYLIPALMHPAGDYTIPGSDMLGGAGDGG